MRFWRVILVLLLVALALGCAKRWYTTTDVPGVSPTFPNGLLVFDIDVGDTRRPQLLFSRAGYVSRRVEIPRSGVLTVKMIAGEWEISVEGTPTESDVITFGGAKGASSDSNVVGPRRWPGEPLEIEVAASKLTVGGHLCAHAACKTTWTPFYDKRFEVWREAGRLALFGGPPKTGPAPKKVGQSPSGVTPATAPATPVDDGLVDEP